MALSWLLEADVSISEEREERRVVGRLKERLGEQLEEELEGERREAMERLERKAMTATGRGEGFLNKFKKMQKELEKAEERASVLRRS